jgi:hypothetical protein
MACEGAAVCLANKHKDSCHSRHVTSRLGCSVRVCVVQYISVNMDEGAV